MFQNVKLYTVKKVDTPTYNVPESEIVYREISRHKAIRRSSNVSEQKLVFREKCRQEACP